MQEVTPRAQDSLVSFGERLSTRLFAAFLNAQASIAASPLATVYTVPKVPPLACVCRPRDSLSLSVAMPPHDSTIPC